MIDSRGLQLLRDARRLVADSWCRGADARNEYGSEVDPWDDEAVSWSLLGALVAVGEREGAHAGALPHDPLAAALYALSALIETDSLVDWNDDPRQTQRNVLAVLDEAAASYEASWPALQLCPN
jgi:hypothetical protein